MKNLEGINQSSATIISTVVIPMGRLHLIKIRTKTSKKSVKNIKVARNIAEKPKQLFK